MRFKLSITAIGSNRNIPINYQYPFSSWIYKTVHEGDKSFAQWLHQTGYTDGNKRFKGFCFSYLQNGKFKANSNRLEIISKNVSLYISFYLPQVAEPFILGLFNAQDFSIGDSKSRVDFKVNTIERLPNPVFKRKMQFRCLSPIHVTHYNERADKTDHLHPDHKEYKRLFFENLQNKYKAFHDKDIDVSNCKLEILTEPRKKGITLKEGTKQQTKLIGYTFNFSLQAPKELMKLGYHAGFGKAGSQGFGCGEVI